MNPYTVILYLLAHGRCWVEVLKAGHQEGVDIDCKTYKAGRIWAARMCDAHGLTGFDEIRIRSATKILESIRTQTAVGGL